MKIHPDPSSRFDELISALQERKYRLTPQRIELVRLIAASEDHPNAAKLFSRVRGQFPTDDPGPFEPALALMYGRETLEQAFALFNQDERFFGLTKLGENFEGSAIHQRLLEAYRKVRG